MVIRVPIGQRPGGDIEPNGGRGASAKVDALEGNELLERARHRGNLFSGVELYDFIASDPAGVGNIKRGDERPVRRSVRRENAKIGIGERGVA